MARRAVNWNEGLAQDLKDPKIAREFILAALHQGLPLQDVLAKTIRAYGIKEFAAQVKMPSSNLLRTINSKHNPTVSSIARILKPFGLELAVSEVKRRRAA